MNERDIVCILTFLGFDKPWAYIVYFQVTRGIHTDCLLNYETVKYFGGEEHEGERYSQALLEYQTLEYKVISESALR